MNSRISFTSSMLFALGVALLAGSASAAADHPKRAQIRASNSLGFALEEMQVVERDLKAEQYDNASRSYKRATKYYSKALKRLEKADLNEEQLEALGKFEDRFEALEPKVESITQSKAHAMLELMGETREFFRVQS